jgi:hypothetical protein
MLKAFFYGVVAAATLAIAPASAQSLTGFLGSSNLDPLAQSPMVLNLEAQSSTHMAQGDVNTFNQFFLINGPGKLVVQFNTALQNLGQVRIPAWIGVAQYSNHDIWFDLQFGFDLVRRQFNMPGAQAGHVVVYKTLNTGQLVYDYAVPIFPGSPTCQEYLFTPVSFGYQLGMRTRCYWTLSQFKRPMGSAAGRD